MILAEMHPEDIKAALRKQFGSVFAFEDEHDLPRKSVSDFLRGRPNQRVRDAIIKIIPQSDMSDGSKAMPDGQRLRDTSIKTRRSAVA